LLFAIDRTEIVRIGDRCVVFVDDKRCEVHNMVMKKLSDLAGKVYEATPNFVKRGLMAATVLGALAMPAYAQSTTTAPIDEKPTATVDETPKSRYMQRRAEFSVTEDKTAGRRPLGEIRIRSFSDDANNHSESLSLRRFLLDAKDGASWSFGLRNAETGRNEKGSGYVHAPQSLFGHWNRVYQSSNKDEVAAGVDAELGNETNNLQILVRGKRQFDDRLSANLSLWKRWQRSDYTARGPSGASQDREIDIDSYGITLGGNLNDINGVDLRGRLGRVSVDAETELLLLTPFGNFGGNSKFGSEFDYTQLGATYKGVSLDLIGLRNNPDGGERSQNLQTLLAFPLSNNARAILAHSDRNVSGTLIVSGDLNLLDLYQRLVNNPDANSVDAQRDAERAYELARRTNVLQIIGGREIGDAPESRRLGLTYNSIFTTPAGEVGGWGASVRRHTGLQDYWDLGAEYTHAGEGIRYNLGGRLEDGEVSRVEVGIAIPTSDFLKPLRKLFD
jgi:hypothetical protein